MSSHSGTVTHRSDDVTEFFDALVEQEGHPPLHRESGTLRFDLRDGSDVEHWYVTVVRGDVSVSHADADADVVIRAEREQFADMVTGRVNVTAALLRGVLDVQGNLGLVASFARLFPAPPGAQALPTSRTARQ